MQEKKGQCPVSFLWRGHGLGSYCMKTALFLMLCLASVKITAMMLHYTFKLDGFLALTLSVWVLGKCLAVLNIGAQKRTRTSTK